MRKVIKKIGQSQFFYVSLHQKKKIMGKFRHILTLVGIYRYIIVSALAVLFLGFVGENCWLSHMKHQSTIKELKKDIAKYKDQYAHDTEQLEQMDNSLEAIRRVARERYFMKAANEDIFIIEED